MLSCDWFLKYAAPQAAGLARAGAEVMLVCRGHAIEFDGDEHERETTLAVARGAGVQVVEIPGRLTDHRVLPHLVALRRRIGRFRAQIGHGHQFGDPRALFLLAGLPKVFTVHDPSRHPGHPVPDAARRVLHQGAERTWRARARAMIVHSERLRAELAPSAAERIHVIAHGIHVEAEPLPAPAQPTVTFFGRLAPYKGLEVLARAMPRVWEQRPEVRLRVAGEGTSELGLSDPRVRFERRYLPESEVGRLFAASTLAVLPYTQASQSGAGSLAAGYGVPVVASRLGGLPDLVLDDSYLVAPGDPGALAQAILRHLDDDLEVRRRVLGEIAAPRSWEAVARRTVEVYAQVLRPR